MPETPFKCERNAKTEEKPPFWKLSAYVWTGPKYLRGDFLQNHALFAQNQSDRTDWNTHLLQDGGVLLSKSLFNAFYMGIIPKNDKGFGQTINNPC